MNMDRHALFLRLISEAWKLFFNTHIDSDDADDENDLPQRRSVPKNTGFFEDTIPRFNHNQFKSHFRLAPASFISLYRDVHLVQGRNFDVRPGRPSIDLEKQILVTLWYLANTESFRSVADRFGIAKKVCWTIVFSICKLILQVNFDNQIIQWPNQEEACSTANFYETKTRFPGVIGSIDGTHIPIPAPKSYLNSYINRKKYHSVLLQAVCNEKMMFLDCYAGEAGSIHDSCLFRRSELYKRIADGSLVIPDNLHILGDQAYGLKTYLLTPFKDNGSLTEQQRKYNKTHSHIRVVIERSFALLKCRFRRLQGLQTRKPELIPLIIIVCCILHNLCLKANDEFDFEFLEELDLSSPNTSENNQPEAQAKRNRITSVL